MSTNNTVSHGPSRLMLALCIASHPLWIGAQEDHARHAAPPEVEKAPAMETSEQAHHAASPEVKMKEMPWTYWDKNPPAPGEPGKDYTPIYVPNGETLQWKVIDGVKVFHLVAEPIEQVIAEGLKVKAWGYNGRTPGPTIEVVQGDRVRIYVTNHLPAETTVHWHGVILPNGMDGIPGLTQPSIKPDETFRYEYIFPHHGTFMYHSHSDEMTQLGMGMAGMIVVHPREPEDPRPDRDFGLMLHEWFIDGGNSRPFPIENMDVNILTINGKVFPETHPLVAKLGDRVRIRIGNLSPENHHPIHLHGHSFKVVETDGGQVPREAQWPETTVLVPVGSVRVIDVIADNLGDWLLHCHMTHHMMNQMGHDVPNMVGVSAEEVEKKIQEIIPGFMLMGHKGMAATHMHMPVPENSIPMLGFQGQFGPISMGGMVTLLKIREEVEGFEDPGPYRFPEETVARKATGDDLQKDEITVSNPQAQPEGGQSSGQMQHH